MERLNIDSITPLKFKNNPFELLKSRMLMLNPSANINWDDFAMHIVPPNGVGSQGTITLFLKHEVKPKYVNPHRTVEFKYTTDISIADIIRNNYNIPEVIHYDDIPELKSAFEYQDTDGRFKSKLFPFPNTNIFNVREERAYKRYDGSYQIESYDWELGEYLSEDVNSRILRVEVNERHGFTITSANIDSPEYTVLLLPATRSSSDTLWFRGERASTATLDFNINGGEFTSNTLNIITLAEITE